MTKTETKRYADGASAQLKIRATSVEDMMATLTEYVNAEKANKNINWGDVGSMAHIELELKNLLEFIGK